MSPANTPEDHSGSNSKTKFKKMTLWRKCIHVWRVFIFLISGGFVYPHIFDE